jgi:hypothetical protein
MMAALPGPIGSPVIAVTAVTSMARYPLFPFRGLVQFMEHSSGFA